MITKLLKGASVEWKPLGQVVFIANNARKPIKASLRSAGQIPYYGANNIQDFVKGYTHDGEYVLIAEDGSRSLENYSIQWVNGKFWANNHVHIVSVKPELLSRFLFHYLSNYDFTPYLTGGSRAKLTKNQMIKISIPIPPLAVQAEVVRILDAFTALTAELTAELKARKKQYNYYRDQLLTFKEGEVKWKTLGDVTLPTSNIRWKDTDLNYRYIDLTSVNRENHSIVQTVVISAKNAPSRAQKVVVKDDIIFATTRPTLQRFSLINDEFSGEVASTGYCVLRAETNRVLPKWIYYNISSTKFNDFVKKYQSGSAYPAISDVKIKEFTIPIPPLTEQERIISILDKFDTLTTSITEGLPKEIALRQQQYEYYRDQLLNFPKA